MRFVHVYLLGYFALVIGAGLALWQAGVLQGISPLWAGVTALAALTLGLLLLLTSQPRPSAAAPE